MSDIKEYPYNLSYSERLEEIIRLREALRGVLSIAENVGTNNYEMDLIKRARKALAEDKP